MDSNLKKIIKDISLRTNIREYEIELIITSQFQFLRKVMGEKEFKSVRFRYLGKFDVNPARKKYILDASKNKNT